MIRPISARPMRRRSPASLLAVCALLSLAAVALTPLVGAVRIDPFAAGAEILHSPRGGWSPDARILADLRLPRALTAWLAGGALAVAGAVLQTLLRNPLATPFTLGVSAAGTFGAFLVLAFPGLALAGSPRPLALAFALAEVFLVLGIGRRTARADGLLLAGVTLNFLFAAGMMLVRYLADPYRLASMDRWLLGSVEVVGFAVPLALLPWLVAGAAPLAWRARALDQLAFDPGLAEARGIDPRAARRDLLLGTGLLTAAVVAHTGPIGFIGLLVPHAVRPFAGLRHAVLLPACWLVGGGFLAVADAAARSLELFGRHSEVPVGILTALIGAPAFLLILWRSR
ncbi:MAG: iron ABC transporter permease [Planctomycetota bacterium]|nr:MAG: iron ABC transporter permease [Planctomycetota bacterium]